MKTKIIKSILSLSFIFGCMFISFKGFSASHITMSLKNISTTANTIEYDLYLVNDGSTSLKLSACAYGVNFNSSILNGGKITYSYVANSRNRSLNGLSSFYLTTIQTDEYNQAKMTTTPSKIDNAPELFKNIPVKVGRFRITNSTTWTLNSNPLLALQELNLAGLTTSQVAIYVESNRALKVLNTNFKTLAVQVETSPILNSSSASEKRNNDASQSSSIIENISIYPNPVESYLRIDFETRNQHEISIRITDLTGKTIKELQTTSKIGSNIVELNVVDLVKGMYSVKITNNESLNFNQLFIKQ